MFSLSRYFLNLRTLSTISKCVEITKHNNNHNCANCIFSLIKCWSWNFDFLSHGLAVKPKTLFLPLPMLEHWWSLFLPMLQRKKTFISPENPHFSHSVSVETERPKLPPLWLPQPQLSTSQSAPRRDQEGKCSNVDEGAYVSSYHNKKKEAQTSESQKNCKLTSLPCFYSLDARRAKGA